LVRDLILLHFLAETFNPLTMDSKIILEAARGTVRAGPATIGQTLHIFAPVEGQMLKR
jgi:hypothetical protein